MNRLRDLARAALVGALRLGRAVVLDLAAIAGFGLIAYGAAQVPVLGAALGPMVLGLGLLYVVRTGSR